MVTVGEPATPVPALLARRREAGEALVAAAPEVVSVAAAIADRFRAGALLLVLGAGDAAADANHVAVEFLHPVIVGKPALPATSLVNDLPTLTAGTLPLNERLVHHVRLLARPGDVALAVARDGGLDSVAPALRAAADFGVTTVALVGGVAGTPAVAGHVLRVPSDDPQVVKEVQVTIYHLLWELVHVFLEQQDRAVPA